MSNAPVAALPSSYQARLWTPTLASRYRPSLQSLGQPFIQPPPSHNLPYSHLPVHDENLEPGLSSFYDQFGRLVEHDVDEDFDFNDELFWQEQISQHQVVLPSHPTDMRAARSGRQAWTLPTPPSTPSPATPLDTGHFASLATTAVPISYKMAFLLNYCRFDIHMYHSVVLRRAFTCNLGSGMQKALMQETTCRSRLAFKRRPIRMVANASHFPWGAL